MHALISSNHATCALSAHVHYHTRLTSLLPLLSSRMFGGGSAAGVGNLRSYHHGMPAFPYHRWRPCGWTRNSRSRRERPRTCLRAPCSPATPGCLSTGCWRNPGPVARCALSHVCSSTGINSTMVATTRAAPKPLATAISPTAAPSSSVTLGALAADGKYGLGWSS